LDQMPAEVRKMAYERAKDADAEGFAEFIRVYITHPDDAKKMVPQFYDSGRSPRMRGKLPRTSAISSP